ncbi:MAG: iron chaperone [Solirubrobacterales bacterium]
MEAETPDAYLAALPEDRRETVAKVRDQILKSLPDGYVEEVRWGMLSYEVPLETYPETYNDQPLSYVTIASQKNYMSLYLMGIYGDEANRAWFEEEAAERGAKLDIGKSCVRFRNLEDLPIDLIGEAVARFTVEDFIEMYEASRS